MFASQTTTLNLVLEADVSQGRLEGAVRDEAGQPLAGATLGVSPGDHLATTDASGHFAFEPPAPGNYAVSASLDGYATREETAVVEGGETTTVDVVLTALPPPPPPASLIANGDFSQGLLAWTSWRERGDLNPSVDGSGQLHLSAVGHNGGVYPSFATGGAGREISIEGSWASAPTAPNAQWAEVLVINGTATPVDGQDLNAGRPDVLLIYKNDTWATSSGWSGDIRSTAAVHAAGSFVAAGDIATIVLKTGTILGVRSGAVFDDIVVSGSAASPLPTPSPTGSKLTIHTGFGGPLSMQFVERAKRGLVKILDSFSGAPEVKRLSPETEIIARAYLASQPRDGDPVRRAREWWDRSRSILPLWAAFYPAIDTALAHGGILGLHEYGTPMQQHFDEGAGEGWLAGRYRKVCRQYLIPTGRPIRLAITECGVDVVPSVGRPRDPGLVELRHRPDRQSAGGLRGRRGAHALACLPGAGERRAPHGAGVPPS